MRGGSQLTAPHYLQVVSEGRLTGLIIQPLAEVHRLYKIDLELTIVGGSLQRPWQHGLALFFMKRAATR